MEPVDITVRRLLYLVGSLTTSIIFLFAVWEVWIAKIWRKYDPADPRRWRYDVITHLAARGPGWRVIATVVPLAATVALWALWHGMGK